jgi:hypothetical protein
MQSRSHEELLSISASEQDFADTVCKISCLSLSPRSVKFEHILGG